MNKVSINENPDPWSQKSENTLKIVFVNCAGLKAHFQDIKTDHKLLHGDVLHLVESSLTAADNEENFKLDGYQKQFISKGLGKGIATYYKSDKCIPCQGINAEKFQITKLNHEVLDIINIYRSQTGNSLDK